MNFLRKLEELKTFAQKLHEAAMRDPEVRTSKAAQLLMIIGDVVSAFRDWTNCGAKIFQLSDDLLEAFTYTDIPMRMTPGDFKYPFDSFIIESGNKPLFITKTNIGPIGVHTLLYSCPESIIKKSGVDPVIVTMDGKKLHGFQSDRIIYGFMPVEEGMERIRLDLGDNVTFEETANHPRSNAVEVACDEDDMRNIINIFYNTVMYINDPSRNIAETQSIQTRKVAVTSGGQKTRQPYILLSTPKNYVPLNRGRHENGELTCRFPVRGHWREQAHGEKHSLRKTIWVFPFWKGPELSEVVSHPYHLK